MEEHKSIAQTAACAATIVEVVSGIVRALDGNSISSNQDGPRDIEADVAVALNRRFSVVTQLGAN